MTRITHSALTVLWVKLTISSGNGLLKNYPRITRCVYGSYASIFSTWVLIFENVLSKWDPLSETQSNPTRASIEMATLRTENSAGHVIVNTTNPNEPWLTSSKVCYGRRRPNAPLHRGNFHNFRSLGFYLARLFHHSTKKNTFRIGLIITVFLWNQFWNLTPAVSKISSYDYDVQQVCTIWWQFLWWKSPVTGYLVSGGGGSSTWRLSSGQPSAGGQRRRAWGASAVEHQAPACWQSPGPPSAHSGLSPHKIYLQWNL